MKSKLETDRAKAIGRMLFQKYDLGKRGALGPKQCYEVFSDYCFRILTIQPQPTMEEANSMYEVLDENKDKKVTEADFQNLALKYLCGINNFSASNFATSNVYNNTNYGANTNAVFSSSNISSHTNSNNLQYSTVTKYTTQIKNERESKKTQNVKALTSIAKKRLDVVRRLFKLFDKDSSGYLTEDEIPFIMEETYKEMGQNYKPTKDDVRSYMKMVDTNNDGKVSLNEFEEIILRSLKNAGFQIYE